MIQDVRVFLLQLKKKWTCLSIKLYHRAKKSQNSLSYALLRTWGFFQKFFCPICCKKLIFKNNEHLGLKVLINTNIQHLTPSCIWTFEEWFCSDSCPSGQKLCSHAPTNFLIKGKISSCDSLLSTPLQK